MFKRGNSIIGQTIEDETDCDKGNDDPAVLGLLVVGVGIKGLFLLI